MAFMNNAYAKYQNNRVLTASPAELTLMLYEGAIKFCNIAIQSLETGQTEKAHRNIVKAQKIIDEFRSTLNHDYPVAEDFERVYKYIGDLLVRANVRKDKAMVEEAAAHLRVMRDTWKQVMKSAGL